MCQLSSQKVYFCDDGINEVLHSTLISTSSVVQEKTADGRVSQVLVIKYVTNLTFFAITLCLMYLGLRKPVFKPWKASWNRVFFLAFTSRFSSTCFASPRIPEANLTDGTWYYLAFAAVLLSYSKTNPGEASSPCTWYHASLNQFTAFWLIEA